MGRQVPRQTSRRAGLRGVWDPGGVVCGLGGDAGDAGGTGQKMQFAIFDVGAYLPSLEVADMLAAPWVGIYPLCRQSTFHRGNLGNIAHRQRVRNPMVY
jgi:hypothetical protein